MRLEEMPSEDISVKRDGMAYLNVTFDTKTNFSLSMLRHLRKVLLKGLPTGITGVDLFCFKSVS
jgi:hypothetical protein